MAFSLEKALAELPERNGNVKSLYFKQSAYTRWATYETFKFINDHPEINTLAAIEQFIGLMEKYIYNSVTDEMKWIFCVAKDQAEYLRDWYVSEEFRR